MYVCMCMYLLSLLILCDKTTATESFTLVRTQWIFNTVHSSSCSALHIVDKSTATTLSVVNVVRNQINLNIMHLHQCCHVKLKLEHSQKTIAFATILVNIEPRKRQENLKEAAALYLSTEEKP